jgi:FAD/FMN-containing dehydrogenase
MAEDVEAELDQVRQLLQSAGGPEPIEVEGVSGTDIWASLLGNTRESVQVRVGVPIKYLPTYIQDQSTTLHTGPFMADFGSGFVYAVMPPNDLDEVRTWLQKLRQPLGLGGRPQGSPLHDGYAIVMQMPEDWQGSLDRWGYRPETQDLMRGLKARWDPHGILNPGVFIV